MDGLPSLEQRLGKACERWKGRTRAGNHFGAFNKPCLPEELTVAQGAGWSPYEDFHRSCLQWTPQVPIRVSHVDFYELLFFHLASTFHSDLQDQHKHKVGRRSKFESPSLL